MIKTVKQWLSPARKNDEAQEQDNLLQLATYMVMSHFICALALELW